MFGRRKREAKKFAEDMKKREIISGYELRLDTAATIEDAGERFLAFKEIEEEIAGRRADFDAENAKKINEAKDKGTFYGLGLISVPLLVTGFVTMNPFLLLIGGGCTSAGGISGALVGDAVGKKKARRREKENEEFFKNLSAVAMRAHNAADDVVEGQIERLARSPKAESIFKDYEFVRDAFAKAAMRKIREENTPPKPPRDKGLNQ